MKWGVSRIGKANVILAAALFGLLLLLLAGASVPVRAGTTTEISLSDGMTVCTSTLGGSWTPQGDLSGSLSVYGQCSLSNNKGGAPVYTVQSGDTLRVDSGVILTWGEGIFNNLGAIENAGAFVDGGGDLVSSGTITNTGAFNMSVASVFNNTGSITTSSPGVLTIISGTLNNFASGTIANTYLFNNHGSIINTGTIANSGTLSNHAGGRLFINVGTITNANSGKLLNFGFITNKGTITNPGVLTDYSYDTIDNSGTIANSGTFNSSRNALITNGGTITNTGMMALLGGGNIFSNGTINNQGSLLNSGSVNNGFGPTSKIVELSNTGTISGNGSILQNNKGDFSNSGTVNLVGLGMIQIDNSAAGYGLEISGSGSITLSSGTTLSASMLGSVANKGTITVDKGGSVIVSSGPTLPFYRFASIGMIIDDGTINDMDTFYNGGTLTINSFGLVEISEEAIFYNSGTLTNSGIIINSEYLTNSGTIPLITSPYFPSSVLNNQTSGGAGLIDNFGMINNTGTMRNGGVYNNYHTTNNVGGFINNTGTFTDEFGGHLFSSYRGVIDNTGGAMVNSGKFLNSGYVRNLLKGAYNNDGFINNTAVIIISKSSRFTNSGTIVNSGSIRNYGSQSGQLENVGGGHLTNDGGSLYNYGVLLNSGNITQDSDGSISNYGTIPGNGTISNGGSFTNYCQGRVTSISGNAPSESPCTTPSIATSSGQTFDTANPRINGTSDANAVVRITEGNLTIGQTTADSTGNWTIVVSPLAAGAHSLTAEALGVGGDSGSVSIQLSISPLATTSSTSVTTSASASSTVPINTSSQSSTSALSSSAETSSVSQDFALYFVAAVVVVVVIGLVGFIYLRRKKPA